MNLKKISVATLAVVVTGLAAHAQDSKDSTKKDTTKSFIAVYQDTTKKDSAKSFVAFYQDTTKKDTSKTLAVVLFQDTTKKDTAKSFVAFYQDTTKKDTSKKDSSIRALVMNLNAIRFYNSFVSLPEKNEAKDENEYTTGIKEDEIIS